MWVRPTPRWPRTDRGTRSLPSVPSRRRTRGARSLILRGSICCRGQLVKVRARAACVRQLQPRGRAPGPIARGLAGGSRAARPRLVRMSHRISARPAPGWTSGPASGLARPRDGDPLRDLSTHRKAPTLGQATALRASPGARSANGIRPVMCTAALRGQGRRHLTTGRECRGRDPGAGQTGSGPRRGGRPHRSPRASLMSRSSTRCPSTRRALCSYSLVIQGRSPFTMAAVSSEKRRST